MDSATSPGATDPGGPEDLSDLLMSEPHAHYAEQRGGHFPTRDEEREADLRIQQEKDDAGYDPDLAAEAAAEDQAARDADSAQVLTAPPGTPPPTSSAAGDPWKPLPATPAPLRPGCAAADAVPSPLDRRARLVVGPDQLLRLLGLPDGLTVLRIEPRFDPPGLAVIVMGNELKPVDPAAESPTVPAEYDPEGRLTWNLNPVTDWTDYPPF
jgi:hypothetical protein